MSSLRRVIIQNSSTLTVVEPERSIGVNPYPVAKPNDDAWARVLGILGRRIALMEANIEKATDEWGDVQGLARADWEQRMKSYAYALQQLHELAEDLTASRSEIP